MAGRGCPARGDVPGAGGGVVDGVDAGGAGFGVGQVGGDLVQAGQDLGGDEVEGGQGVGGGAELAHQGGGGDVVPGHVADDEGAAVLGQRDDVEPVAADLGAGLGGDVAVADLKAGDLGDLPGQQAALQGERGGPLAGVEPGVVDADRRAGDQVPGQRQVRGSERLRAGQAVQDDDAHDDAPGGQREDHHRVGARRRAASIRSEARAGVHLPELLGGHGPERRQVDRQPGDQALVVRLGRVGLQPGMPEVFRRGPAGHRPPQRDALQAHRLVGCLRCVLVTVDDGGEQVDRARVGQPRDGHLEQFLRGPGDVQRGPDPEARLVGQREPVAGCGRAR